VFEVKQKRGGSGKCYLVPARRIGARTGCFSHGPGGGKRRLGQCYRDIVTGWDEG